MSSDTETAETEAPALSDAQQRALEHLQAALGEPAPAVDSWITVYPGADWHERECWEMYGFRFEGHPSLRHLYLPSEFEGHPLRKDYPLLSRVVKPWPGLVDVEPMPGEVGPATENGADGGTADVAPSADADQSADADKGDGS